MSRIKLTLDDLRVQTFLTSGATTAGEHGVVYGQSAGDTQDNDFTTCTTDAGCSFQSCPTR